MAERRPLEKDGVIVDSRSIDDYIRLAFAALDSKMKQGGVVTLANVQMEHAALKALHSDIFLQLSQAVKGKRDEIKEKSAEDCSQKRHAIRILRARIKSNGRLTDKSELRIRMKLIELRRLDEKTEQQANIINSGQIDLWLQEHHQEMEELQENLNQLRNTVSQQAATLHAFEKNKIDRVIINQEEVLEREEKRLKQSIQDNLKIALKLEKFNEKQYAELEAMQKVYVEITKDLEHDVDELLDLDIDSNISKYWQLLTKRHSLERQVTSLGRTVKQ